MITTRRVSNYSQLSQRQLQARADAVAMIPEADIVIPDGGPEPIIIGVPDVVYTHFKDRPEEFFSMTGFTSQEFDQLYIVSTEAFHQPRR